jgi:hypothetical protein
MEDPNENSSRKRPRTEESPTTSAPSSTTKDQESSQPEPNTPVGPDAAATTTPAPSSTKAQTNSPPDVEKVAAPPSSAPTSTTKDEDPKPEPNTPVGPDAAATTTPAPSSTEAQNNSPPIVEKVAPPPSAPTSSSTTKNEDPKPEPNTPVGPADAASASATAPSSTEAAHDKPPAVEKVAPPEPPKSPQTILVEQLRSADVNTRNQALNKVLQLSAGYETSSSQLESDALLLELVQIAFKTLEWTPLGEDDNEEMPSFKSATAWTKHVSAESERWAKHCQEKFAIRSATGSKLLPFQIIVMILRNFSFTATNVRLMAYSPPVLQVLVGALYESTSRNNLNAGLTEASNGSGASNNTNPSSFALPALQALVHLSPCLDVTGLRLYIDRLFLSTKVSSTLSSATDDRPVMPEDHRFGRLADGSWGFGGLYMAKKFDPKEDEIQDVTTAQVLQETKDHIVSIWSIFPALQRVLTDSQAHRLVLMAAVELLQEFINHARVGMVGSVEELEKDQDKLPNARQILVHIPDNALLRLSDLLYIPRLGPGSLDYVDPVHNIVTRVNPVKLLLGYDSTVDADVRDRALDLLVPLLELDSPRLAKRLGSTESDDQEQNKRLGYGRPQIRLFDALMCILVSRAGRNEAPILATQLLRELAKAPENRVSLLYIQSRMLRLASRDPARLAHLAMNDLYPVDSLDTPAVSDDMDASPTH